MSDGSESAVRGPIVEAEFEVSDPSYPFVGLSERADCRVELVELLPREDGRTAEYFSVAGADPERALEYASRDGIVDARVHLRTGSSGLFEYVVERNCPVRALATRGAVPTTVSAAGGTGTIVVEILPGEDATEVIAAFLDEHDAELVAKRRKSEPTPRFSQRDVQPPILQRLTDRQREVLFAAFDAGYYERPRETTGEDLAAELGITAPTFQQHLRSAERKVVAFLAEDRTD